MICVGKSPGPARADSGPPFYARTCPAGPRVRGVAVPVEPRRAERPRLRPCTALPFSSGWQGRAELAAGLEHREPDKTETWAIDAGLARAVAAAERNQVLPGLWIEAEEGTAGSPAT